MSHSDKDLKKIEELVELMKKNDLIELEISHGDEKIQLKRSDPRPSQVTAMPIVAPVANGVPVQPAAAGEPAAAAEQSDDNLVNITSPMVGTFYSAPGPEMDDFVEIGSAVGDQTVVGIIEAMKVMNEIKAETTGTIAEIKVKNGQAVEYGQVLFRVKPD